MPDLQTLTLEDFTSLVGQEFNIRLGNDEIYTLQLEECVSLSETHSLSEPPSLSETPPQIETPGHTRPGFRKPFALHFSSPRRDAYLPQRVYCLENAAAGVFEIFIVPLGPDAHGMRYEAIFY